MPHEINRILRAFSATPWFIDPAKAEQIVGMLELRALNGPRAEPFNAEQNTRQPVQNREGRVAVLRLYGTIAPRAEAISDVSQSAALMTQFQAAFREVANDPDISAIILDVDSPGGQVDLVPETAAMIREARNPDRPIVAVANTLAASAAYWIASQADELVVTPSGAVGSIGVYVLHEDVSEALAEAGIRCTLISGGARKTEGNPFEPLGDEARRAMQANVEHYYGMFVSDVAKGRGVSASVVRADPENSDKHFGGGRAYPAKQAVKLGMADRVGTLDDTIRRLSKPGRRSGTGTRRKRLAIATQ